jgi:hypothetical protein
MLGAQAVADATNDDALALAVAFSGGGLSESDWLRA